MFSSLSILVTRDRCESVDPTLATELQCIHLLTIAISPAPGSEDVESAIYHNHIHAEEPCEFSHARRQPPSNRRRPYVPVKQNFH